MAGFYTSGPSTAKSQMASGTTLKEARVVHVSGAAPASTTKTTEVEFTPRQEVVIQTPEVELVTGSELAYIAAMILS